MPHMPRMHVGQVDTSRDLVRRLLTQQFPQWSKAQISIVDSFGTDHDIYRVGEQICVRLPKVGWAATQARKEQRWLPIFAPHLPARVPTQLAIGEPAEGYPFEWSIYEWIPGSDANRAEFDADQLAEELATFVIALRAVSSADAETRPAGARGCPLSELDDAVRESIAQLANDISVDAISKLWHESLEATPWDEPETWVHGDLLGGNLIIDNRRLVAVIDWGALNVGDPACDLLVAWTTFSEGSRAILRGALRVDDDSWVRGRGWALYQAVMALPYYRNTNPGMVRQAKRSLTAITSSGI